MLAFSKKNVTQPCITQLCVSFICIYQKKVNKYLLYRRHALINKESSEGTVA